MEKRLYFHELGSSRVLSASECSGECTSLLGMASFSVEADMVSGSEEQVVRAGSGVEWSGGSKRAGL